MNRFQKKCLVGSAMTHGLLLVVLIFGTAFFTSDQKPIESAHIIELIDFTVTDSKTRGGNPAPATATPVQTASLPPPEPVRPKPALPEPERERVVEPPKPKPTEPKETVSELPTPKKPKKVLPEPAPKQTAKVTPKAEPTKRIVDISKPTVRNVRDKQAEADAAEKAERAVQQRIRNQQIAALTGARRNLEQNLSSGTTIEMPGGIGGQAEVNYGDLVLKKYDDTWFAPAEVSDNEAIVKARVVIARNGNVISADVIKASGNVSLDKSVRRALELRFIHPFPAGSRDTQRTYIINFNLKTKRGIG